MSLRTLPIKRQTACPESKSANTWIFWASECSIQYLSLQEGGVWLLSHMAAPWLVPYWLENSESILQDHFWRKGKALEWFTVINTSLQNDPCSYPIRNSCMLEENRLAEGRDEFLWSLRLFSAWIKMFYHKCDLRGSSVTWQASIFQLLLGGLECILPMWAYAVYADRWEWKRLLVGMIWEGDEGLLEHFRLLLLGSNTHTPRQTNLLNIFMSLWAQLVLAGVTWLQPERQ